MSRNRKFTANQWLEHKEIIRRLWIEEHHSFSEVATELAKLEFCPTKRQFEFQISKWGWSKYAKSRDKNTLLSPYATLSKSDQIEAVFGGKGYVICDNISLSKKNFLRWQKRNAKRLRKDSGTQQRSHLPSAIENPSVTPAQHRVSFVALQTPLESSDSTNFWKQASRTSYLDQPLSDDPYRSAYEAQLRCDYAAAESLYRVAAQRWHAGVGPSNISILSIYRRVAVCLLNQGDVKGAFQLNSILHEMTRQRPQANIHQSLSILHTLGTIHEAMGNLNIAEQHHQKVLQIAVQSLGRMHSFTITAMASFASVLRMKNKLADSEQLYSKVLGLRLRMGADEFYVCQELRQLADILSDSGRISESLRLYKTAEQRAIASLGKLHQVTLRIQSNLAADLRIVGSLDDSEKLLRTTIANQKAVLGDNHPDAHWTSYQYAKCLMAMNRYNDALIEFQKVSLYRKQHLGEFHIRTLNCHIWIGWCSERACQTRSALANYQHVLMKLHQCSTLETYSDVYRVRWLKKAVARTLVLTSSSVCLDGFLLETTLQDAAQPLEIVNVDGSPVQCVIEEESGCPETCAVAS